MKFAEAIKEETTWTRTENGAEAKNTTGNACLDLFGTIGALRERRDKEVIRLFKAAYQEDPLTATRILFYARDVRGGLGERKTFRTILEYAAENYPECVRPNIGFIGFFGRFDDLYSLVGTRCEEAMWDYMSIVFEFDLKSDSPSLLAKWIKTPDASSKKTRELGILTAKKLGYSVYGFKRKLRALRKKIKVVERDMSANNWIDINYSAVPSRAMMNYRNAFVKHDQERFVKYISDVKAGKSTIHSGTLYPYDIVEKILCRGEDSDTLEEQWKALPNYVEPGTNMMVVADVSGSMYGRPLATSIGLAIYFAERNTGAYHNMFLSFSSDSEINSLKGDTLVEKIRNVNRAHWGMSTNLEAAFQNILDIAELYKVSAEEMVKSLIIISDMEIDAAEQYDRWNEKHVPRHATFYDRMKAKYAEHGYVIPNIIFWNVNSRHDIFHADKDREGVQLVSGQSASTFKNLIDSFNMTPMEMMERVINSGRYQVITIS